MRAAAVLLLAAHAAAHGVLNKPLSRNGAQAEQKGNHAGLPNGGKGVWSVASWFSNNVKFVGNVTVDVDRCELLTACNSGCPSEANPHPDCQWTAKKGCPWRAPGTAPVLSPCGVINGAAGGSSREKGKGDGRDLTYPPEWLPNATIPTWTAGGIEEVAWAISANHGGGYTYRLCPAGGLTEECFQRTPLPFVGDTTDIIDGDGKVLHTIKATRTTVGTVPEGSMWTKNPIPMSTRNFPPPEGGYTGAPTSVNLLDRVQVPAGLAPGRYVLGWRWDCESTNEVWANCADVLIA